MDSPVQVATPHLRNMGTIGGNICLDTRCSYYDQNLGWRKAIDYCMKKDGEVCWVSTALLGVVLYFVLHHLLHLLGVH